MGFGFNLFFVFILVPGTLLLLVIWAVMRQAWVGKLLAVIWVSVVGLVILSMIAQSYYSKVELSKDDYYGEYVIDRNMFGGPQTNWQYNSFRFEIKPNDSIYFHVMEAGVVYRTFLGSITSVAPYSSHRLRLAMEKPTHHIVLKDPTTHRTNKGFTLTFDSPCFNTVYFRKGEWSPLGKSDELPKVIIPSETCPQSEHIRFCSIATLKRVHERLDDLDPALVTDLLTSFDPACEPNVEFMQWANELLFEVIRREPAITSRSFMVRSEIHQNMILKALAHPIHDAIDLDKVIIALEGVDQGPEVRYREMMVKSISSTKSGSQ